MNPEVRARLGVSANRYVKFLLNNPASEGWNQPDWFEFNWDGWLCAYKYPKSEFPDPDPIMRHHLLYNVGCDAESAQFYEDYERTHPEVNMYSSECPDYEREYKGEPPEDYVFDFPPDDRHSNIIKPIDDNFCGLNIDWARLLECDVVPDAKCFSMEQEQLWLIDTGDYYWVINYEYC